MTTLADIVRLLDAKPCGEGYRSKCPVHKDKHPSLWFGEVARKKGPGTQLVFDCKAGCHYTHIRTAVGLSNSGEFEQSVNNRTPERDALSESLKRGKIHAVWDNSIPVQVNSPVWKYLVHTRRVLYADSPIPACLREANLKYYNSDGEYVDTFVCMVAALTAPDGSIATIHRTYVDSDGRKPRILTSEGLAVKKLMSTPVAGCTDGAAIKLFDPFQFSDPSNTGGTILGIAEGIETALACYTLFNIPTWAAWSSGGMSKLVVPMGISDLIIFSDYDTAGQKAAGQLIRRLQKERPEITVRNHMPRLQGTDFADEIANG